MNNPEYISDGDCDNYGMHNTAKCNYDGGDCEAFNKKYPNCTAPYESLLGDGYCLTLMAGCIIPKIAVTMKVTAIPLINSIMIAMCGTCGARRWYMSAQYGRL